MTKCPSVKHLTRITRTDLGHITRYVAACGASGTQSRDYSANVTKKNKRGEVVQVVTCKTCLALYAMTHPIML